MSIEFHLGIWNYFVFCILYGKSQLKPFKVFDCFNLEVFLLTRSF